MRRTLLVLAVAVLLAGCSGLAFTDDGSDQLDDGIGVVDNVGYDDAVSVTTDDGLNESELDTLAARAMARIEVIRGLDFDSDVDVTLQSRERYRSERSETDRDDVEVRWQNQVWKALFIVGEDRDVTSVLDQTLGEAVQGYYTPTDEEIVVITDGETARLSTETLVHELVHALQDQQFGLEAVGHPRDRSMALEGVVEGEAEVLTERYFERCGDEWSCVPSSRTGGDSGNVDPGILRVLLHPYEKGAQFVEHTVESGGWEAVDALHERYPTSTAEIIDPDSYPASNPVNLTVADESNGEWSRLAHDPVSETVGQAAIHVMFWQNRVIEVDEPYSYSHPASEGWAGDELVPYESDQDAGYVWKLRWERVDDATQFTETYKKLLDERDGLERGPRQFVIDEGPYQGAYDIYRNGTTVTIVHGPDIDSLSEIHDAGS